MLVELANRKKMLILKETTVSTRGDVENTDSCFVGHGVTCLTFTAFY